MNEIEDGRASLNFKKFEQQLQLPFIGFRGNKNK